MNDDLVKRLQNVQFWQAECDMRMQAAACIEKLETENEKLRKALDIYERERTRFRHAKPEITGEFFIAGQHGPKDDNMLPQFIEVCPAYGCGWVQIYEKTDKNIMYEGS